jgi:hypothetical protein
MLAALAPILALQLAAVSPAEIREATRDVLDDPGYQTQIPEDAAQPPLRPRRRGSHPATALSSALMWLLIAVAGGVLVVWLVLQLQRFEPSSPVPDPVEARAGPTAPSAGPAGLDPGELARAGRYDEAIHQLLLRALAHLRTTRGRLPDSLTSREVLREIPLGSEAHTALRALTGAVELSLFGGRSTAADDYSQCAEQLRAFLASAPAGAGR